MAKRNRETLKESFQKGKKPTVDDFENLIDSTLNILDDGFSKSPEAGMGLAPLLGKGTVLSVFKEISDAKPQWELAINRENSLEIRRTREGEKDATALLTLKADGSVEVTEEGKMAIFGGTVRMAAREGSLYRGLAPADGRWHDVTNALDGCQVLEVVATTGERNSGRHAVLTATATTCFGRHSKIRKTDAHFGLYGNKIRIRWKKTKGEYSAKLQIKTIFKYDEGTNIRYHIASLCHDTTPQ